MDVLTCCFECGNCNGGKTSLVWQYYKNHGYVTGDGYDNDTWCKPYFLPPCSHNGLGPYFFCEEDVTSTPSC